MYPYNAVLCVCIQGVSLLCDAFNRILLFFCKYQVMFVCQLYALFGHKKLAQQCKKRSQNGITVFLHIMR